MYQTRSPIEYIDVAETWPIFLDVHHCHESPHHHLAEKLIRFRLKYIINCKKINESFGASRN